MYKYRVLECPSDGPAITHPETESEDEAKSQAKQNVAETHHTCYIERYDGEKWQRGSIRYFWYFDRVCFWN